MTETERVGEQLKTLSILYYVYAGLHVLGMCFGGLYVALGGFVDTAVRNTPERAEGAEFVGGFLAVIGAAIGCFFLVGGICCFLTARWMAARKNRTFSQVIAAITCLNVPLGTALGVFTFIVLAKPEAEALYAEAAGTPPV